MDSSPHRRKKDGQFFFKTVDDLSVNITKKVINVNDNKAQASFTVKMFYRNKSKNAKEQRSLPKNWSLKKSSGNWILSP